jgi:hypothetical protein
MKKLNLRVVAITLWFIVIMMIAFSCAKETQEENLPPTQQEENNTLDTIDIRYWYDFTIDSGLIFLTNASEIAESNNGSHPYGLDIIDIHYNHLYYIVPSVVNPINYEYSLNEFCIKDVRYEDPYEDKSGIIILDGDCDVDPHFKRIYYYRNFYGKSITFSDSTTTIIRDSTISIVYIE